MTRLFWRVFEWPAALLLAFATRLVLATSRVESDPALERRGVVFVIFHRHLPLVVPLCGRRRAWMMMSAAPKMRPIARWARGCGLRLVRGASGERGREALEELARELRSGAPVLLAVDGPAGPPFVVKPGCVDLARETGAELVPLASRGRGTFTVPGRWDRLRAAWPFSRLALVSSEPISPTSDRAHDLARVQAALEALERATAR